MLLCFSRTVLFSLRAIITVEFTGCRLRWRRSMCSCIDLKRLGAAVSSRRNSYNTRKSIYRATSDCKKLYLDHSINIIQYGKFGSEMGHIMAHGKGSSPLRHSNSFGCYLAFPSQCAKNLSLGTRENRIMRNLRH